MRGHNGVSQSSLVLLALTLSVGAMLPNFDEMPPEPGMYDSMNDEIRQQEVVTSNSRRNVPYGAKAIRNNIGLIENVEPAIPDHDGERSIDPASIGQEDDLERQKKSNDARDKRIKQLVADFKLLQPKEITDNRITKFIFSDDSELVTSKTVQMHNKAIAVAFEDFSQKLKETLTPSVKPVTNYQKVDSSSRADGRVNRVVHFLDRAINKLEGRPPQQQDTLSHDTSDDYEANYPALIGQHVQFPPVAKTRDDLESILIGLDRPRSQLIRRQIVGDGN